MANISKKCSHTDKVIYDFGSNNGDDIPYYLKKADKVIAVEANPILTTQIMQRFQNEISSGKLFVENCVLTTEDYKESVIFYIHKFNHLLSQFPRPETRFIDNFDEVRLPAKNILNLISTHGEPYYIKIDIEHYDQEILKDLFNHHIYPPFISAEAHSIEIFSLLVSSGGYKSFNLVDGESVSKKYRNCRIQSSHGLEIYSFPDHSAGPFGTDIQGSWMTPDTFFRYLAFEQLGWKDIHATNVIEPDPDYYPRLRHYLINAVKSKLFNALGVFRA